MPQILHACLTRQQGHVKTAYNLYKTLYKLFNAMSSVFHLHTQQQQDLDHTLRHSLLRNVWQVVVL